ncbi:MAG TPA: hypothetical protein VML75_06100 [Kofleriaceae bacterium]|nr:hypothetical protein [Kofleriaceae bacterium]
MMWIATGALACSSPASEALESRPAAHPAPIDAGIDASLAIDAGPPLDEVTARVLLAERFRAAGLRVRYDVRLTGAGYDFTVDGFDPDRRIGYEYVAPSELHTDLDDTEPDHLAADATLHILLIGPADEPTVMAAADAFLTRVVPPDAGLTP